MKEARKGPLVPLEEVFVLVVGLYCCGKGSTAPRRKLRRIERVGENIVVVRR